MPILIPTKPQFSRLIFIKRKKDVDVRKTSIKFQKNEIAIVYESAPTSAVVGFYKITNVIKGSPEAIWIRFRANVCISRIQFFTYFNGKKWAYAIRIKDPTLFEKKVSLGKLRDICRFRNAPQNFRYLTYSSLRRIFEEASQPDFMRYFKRHPNKDKHLIMKSGTLNAYFKKDF